MILYKSGFNHSKILVSDDSLASCGSLNVDIRSFEHDFECNAFFYDKDMALRLKKVFTDDERDCVPLEDVKDLTNRTLCSVCGKVSSAFSRR